MEPKLEGNLQIPHFWQNTLETQLGCWIHRPFTGHVTSECRLSFVQTVILKVVLVKTLVVCFILMFMGTAAMMLRHTEIFISDTSFQLCAHIMKQQIFGCFMTLWYYFRYLHAIIICICWKKQCETGGEKFSMWHCKIISLSCLWHFCFVTQHNPHVSVHFFTVNSIMIIIS
jgi:hypothetical protein